MNSYLRIAAIMFEKIFRGNRYPIGISIDITKHCNLRCKHCYFFPQGYDSELGDKEMINRLLELKRQHPGMLHASWIGGEPLLRKDLVREGMKLFDFNMVVTNGTIKLPDWHDCVFNVSVDGTKKYYEKIRGPHYDKVKKNLDRSDLHINIACVLTMDNYMCIEDMLKEWHKTKVNGICFDFYTPIAGNPDTLWISWKLRDEIVAKLLILKRKYGNFLMMSEPILELLKSENARAVTDNCPTKKYALCIDPLGNIKKPCVLGKKADCSRCGCIIPFQIESTIVRKQWKSFYITKKGFIG